jgi:predicted ATPase with chaperone activity
VLLGRAKELAYASLHQLCGPLLDRLDMLTSIGMEAFAERARNELAATGERVRQRSVETRDDLTAQERQIAQLAR